MTKRTKIALIGGGGFRWTANFVRDLIVADGLQGTTLCLEDLYDEEGLAINARFARKVADLTGKDIKIEATMDQEEALRDADYVMLSINTGDDRCRPNDYGIPEKYGIFQTIGDTVGPGGLSRILRNVPVVAAFVQEMERLCPDAVLINYSNPMTAITRTVYKTSKVKAIGCCHELFGTYQHLTRLFKCGYEEIKLRMGGINHFIWIYSLNIKSHDGLALIGKFARRDRAGVPIEMDWEHWEENMEVFKFRVELLERFGCLPAAGNRHIAEFFPYFLNTLDYAEKTWHIDYNTVAKISRMKQEKKERILRMLAGEEEIPLTKSEEAASDIIRALRNHQELLTVANLPNRGQIDNLPREAVVETLAYVSESGFQPVAVGPIPRGLAGHMYKHVMNQELAIDAALTGDRDLALQSLLGDPLVKDYEKAKDLLAELLEANKPYLPKFF